MSHACVSFTFLLVMQCLKNIVFIQIVYAQNIIPNFQNKQYTFFHESNKILLLII